MPEPQAEQRRMLEEWHDFLRREGHLLSRRPSLIHQQAANQPDTQAPAVAARRRRSRGIWLRWLNKDQQPAQPLLTLAASSATSGDCAFFPDGNRVLAASGPALVIFDARTGEQQARLETGGEWVVAVAVSGNGSRLASRTNDGALHLWDAHDGTLVAELTGPRTRRGGLEALCRFSPDSSQLLALGAQHVLQLWEAAGGRPLAQLAGHTGDVEGVAFSPDGRRLASASADGTIRLWELPDAALVAELRGRVWHCCFSHDGSLLAAAGPGSRVYLWDGRNGEHRGELSGHSGDLRWCAFSPDDTMLVSCGAEGELRLFDVGARRERACLASGTPYVRSFCDFILDGRWIVSNDMEIYDAGSFARVAATARGSFRDFSPSTRTFLTGSLGSPLQLWTLAAAMQPRATRNAHFACRFAPAGTAIAGWGGFDFADPTAGAVPVLYDSSGREIVALHGHENVVDDLAFAPDGNGLLTCSRDGTLRTWSGEPPSARAVLRGHRGRVRSCAVAPDGSFAVSASNDGTVRIWDPQRGIELALLLEGQMVVDHCRIAPGSRRIAAVTTDHVVRLWRAPELTLVAALTGHADFIEDLAFSPDGSLLASASWDRTVRLWDTATGALAGVLRHHQDGVIRCAFAPDGERLASAGRDGVCICVPSSGRLVQRFPGPERQPTGLGWSPDGQLLAVSWVEGTVTWWDALTGKETATYLCEGVGALDWSPEGSRVAILATDGLRVLELVREP